MLEKTTREQWRDRYLCPPSILGRIWRWLKGPDPKNITIIDRLRALNLDASKAQRWSIGQATRDRWLEETGGLPEKMLRTKTAGTGSHCFAVYPPCFVPVIDEVIEAHRLSQSSQLRLFE